MAKKKVTKQSGEKKTRKPKSVDFGASVKAPPVSKGMRRAVSAPEYFRFDKFGLSVRGTYKKLQPATKKGYSDTLILEGDDKQQVFVPFQANIEKIFELNDIVIGDYVVITFVDVVEIAKGRRMKKFVVDYLPAKKGK